MLVGQGKAGDILRNLLLEVAEAGDGNDWQRLVEIVSDVFGYRLLKPAYAGAPYITCQYLKGIPTGNGFGGFPPLDVSTTGSGFHQVLLILAFMFARPSSLILLDEPDAHLHVLLQKQLYDILHRLCHERKGQLLIATHSEVLIDNTSPEQIVSFYREPHPLALPDREITADGLTILRWERYEAESYLLHPTSLERFLNAENGHPFCQTSDGLPARTAAASVFPFTARGQCVPSRRTCGQNPIAGLACKSRCRHFEK